MFTRAGERTKALAVVDELAAMARQRYVAPSDFAVVYAGLGDADATFRWLEKAYRARSIGLSELTSMYYDGLRTDPRYEDLRKRAGIPVPPSERAAVSQ
jgi:hypothetical protein